MKCLKQFSFPNNGDNKRTTSKFNFVPPRMVLIVSIMLGFCMHVQAQNLSLETFGIKGGINTFNITGSEAGDTRALVGFHLGAFAEIKLRSNLSVNPELLFALNHWDGPNSSNDITVYWTNLDLPVMLQLDLQEIAEGLSIHAGPQLGILLSAKNKGTASDGTKVDVDRSDAVKSTNLILGVGAGYKLPAGIQFTIRYLLGLSQLGQDEQGTILSDVKTRSLQFSVVYPIFKK